MRLRWHRNIHNHDGRCGRHSRAYRLEVGVRPGVRGYSEKTAQTVFERSFVIVQIAFIRRFFIIFVTVVQTVTDGLFFGFFLCLLLLVVLRFLV